MYNLDEVDFTFIKIKKVLAILKAQDDFTSSMTLKVSAILDIKYG